MHKKFKDRLFQVKDKDARENVQTSMKVEMPDQPDVVATGMAVVGAILREDGAVEVIVGGYMAPEDLAGMIASLMQTLNDDVIPAFEKETDDEFH